MMPSRKRSHIPPADRPLTVPVEIDLDLLDALIDSDIPGATRNEKFLNAIRRGLEIEEAGRELPERPPLPELGTVADLGEQAQARAIA